MEGRQLTLGGLWSQAAWGQSPVLSSAVCDFHGQNLSLFCSFLFCKREVALVPVSVLL